MSRLPSASRESSKKLYIDSGISYGTITVKDSTGNVIVSNASGSEMEADVQVGTVPTVEVTPAQGYRLKANTLKIGDKVILPNASGVYQFTMPTTVSDRIGLGAIFEQGTPTASTTGRTGSIALGVGVSVAVVNHDKQAYVNAASGPVEAGGLDISAESSNISSGGYFQKRLYGSRSGLAGALTVHVVKAKNSAELNHDLILAAAALILRPTCQRASLLL